MMRFFYETLFWKDNEKYPPIRSITFMGRFVFEFYSKKFLVFFFLLSFVYFHKNRSTNIKNYKKSKIYSDSGFVEK